MITAARAVFETSQRVSPQGDAAPPEAAESRALVVVTPVAATVDLPPRQPRRTCAPFLAQLIATDRKFPQTRARNRLDPHDAAAAYRAVGGLLKRAG